jgi:hypothetical protein
MDGGRILLGDNSVDGTIVLWPIRFQVNGVEIQLDSLLYTHTHTHTHTHTNVFNHMYSQLRLALDLPERVYFVLLL